MAGDLSESSDVRLAYLVLLFAAVAIFMGGCSASVCAGSGCKGGIDIGKAESSTKALVASSTGADVKSVTCPSSEPLKDGASFTCTATGADGTTASVLLTQTDAKGNVTVSAPTLMHTGDDAKVIASGLTSKLKFTVVVKCPDLVSAHKGTTLTCLANHPGAAEHKVLVTVTDAKGDISYRVE